MSEKTAQALLVLTEIFQNNMSEGAVQFYLTQLSAYREDLVLNALKRCGIECKRFPAPAEIIERIDDGHPGVEEAWSLVPKNEDQSIVWTTLIRDAYSACSTLVGFDNIAARQAFKERYKQILSDARARQEPPHWEVSLGHDKSQRDSVLLEAARKNRLNGSRAESVLGHLTQQARFDNKSLPQDTESVQARQKLRGLIDMIKNK